MKNLSILFFLFLSILPCSAIQEDKKISLNDAINLTLKTNPQLELAQLDIDIARNKILTANRLQNPSLSTLQQMPSYGSGDPQTISATILIELFKRDKRKNTEKAYSLALSDYKKFLENNLKAEVKKAYIDLLLKKTHLKVLDKQKNLADELYQTMQMEYKKGLIPESEVIQAKIVLNQSIMSENTAKSEVISSQNRFNAVLNTSNINYDTKEDELSDDYAVLMTIDPKKEIPDFEKILNFALDNRYDLLMAQKEITAAQKRLQEVKSQKIPDIELTGGYAYFSKGMNDGHYQDGAFAGVSLVNIPILYNFKPEIQNAQIEIEKAKLKYYDMKTDTQRNLTDAFEKFSTARDNLNLYNKEILADSKSLIEISRKNLDKKEIDLTSYLVSKKLYLELEIGYLDTLGEYYTSYAELLKEINTDSLAEFGI